MISIIRNSGITEYLWGFVALVILNCSVSTPDLIDNRSLSKGYYNEQESIVEILVEKVMGFENAIAENNNEESDQVFSLKKNQFFQIYQSFGNPFSALENSPGDKAKVFFSTRQMPLSAFSEVNSPPPEL